MTIRNEAGILGTNCFFHVYADGEGRQRAVVVDPAQDGRALARRLSERGVEPVGIVFTHGHLDHTAGASDFLAFFRERGTALRCAIHADDLPYLGAAGFETNRRLFAGLGDEGLFRGIYKPLPEADVVLKDGDRVFDSDLRVLHTPGHSRGSICLVSDGDRLVYSGDTLFRMGVGRTDGPDGDAAALEASLERLFSAVPNEYDCFPGHGGQTTLRAERLILFP